MSIKSAEIKFENDYLYRSNRSITSVPDIAITEFVANAWDAGANNVRIIIPQIDDTEKVISVEDDGIGMTEEEFNERWMTLNYDRQKKQGKNVTFPSDTENYNRIAYGHNGVGRHGMLCFNTIYTVETWKNGKSNNYVISLSSGRQPFEIVDHTVSDKEGHGTRISAVIEKNHPDVNNMIEIISARFLYDPNFTVKINGITVSLETHSNIIDEKDITIGKVKLNIVIIDSTKTSINTQQSGIAFWVCGRLVGKPSWLIDGHQVLDGRVKAAKRYTIIVKTDDLLDDILPDWSGFRDSVNMKQFWFDFMPSIKEIVNSLMKSQIVDLRSTVIEETREKLEELTVYEKREVSTFIETITQINPVVSVDYLKNAIEAVIAMQEASSGEKLLSQISKLSSDEIDRLSDLLDNWSVNDILTVMSEIDRRITIVEAISRTCDEKTTDELHTLHPLIASARWLFGAEFDSPMFTYNKTLSTVLRTIFEKRGYDISKVTNPRRRPDIVILSESTFSAVCTERADVEANNIMKPDQILIIELKRGGFEINYKELTQAMDYVRQIKKAGELHKNSSIHAFVVGSVIGDIPTHNEPDDGIIDVVTYDQLVQTAKNKLFRLREMLSDHYEQIDDKSLVEMAIGNYCQTRLNDNE